MQASPHRRNAGSDPQPDAKTFGDLVTCDHVVTQSTADTSVDGDRTALVIQDRATRWLECHPRASKTAEDAKAALQHFVGPTDKVSLLYCDNASELLGAAHSLGW